MFIDRRERKKNRKGITHMNKGILTSNVRSNFLADFPVLLATVRSAFESHTSQPPHSGVDLSSKYLEGSQGFMEHSR